MGVVIKVENGYINVKVDGCLKGVEIFMEMVSVGVIENLFMVVMLVDGKIVFENVVCEFEIIDFVNCLIVMGVKISGVGISCIEIEGVELLFGCEYSIFLDCIEIGIFLVVVVMVGGEVLCKNIDYYSLDFVIEKLCVMNVLVEVIDNSIYFDMCGCELKVVNIKIMLYLGFLIDM